MDLLRSFKNYDLYLTIEIVSCLLYFLSSLVVAHLFQFTPYDREIPYQVTANNDIILDQYINRPLVERESVPDWLLAVVCLILPFIIMIIFDFKGRRGDLHAGLCRLMFALGCNEFVTLWLKLYAGYFRPNFYSLCNYDTDTMECQSNTFKSRKSFPSGHASLSFCSMTILSLFFLDKAKSYTHDNGRPFNFDTEADMIKSYFKGRIAKIFAVLPMLLAIFISASRVHDDMHHPADIVAGALIGFTSAKFAHSLWHNNLYSTF